MQKIPGMGNRETPAKAVKSTAGSILLGNSEIETFPAYVYSPGLHVDGFSMLVWKQSLMVSLKCCTVIKFAPSNI